MMDVWRDLIDTVGPGRPDLVGAMEERRALGIERYGAPLRLDDGRDHVRDLVEELLDGAAYAWRLDHTDLAIDLLELVAWLARRHERNDLTPFWGGRTTPRVPEGGPPPG